MGILLKNAKLVGHNNRFRRRLAGERLVHERRAISDHD
jgi:hypothetical protein